MGPCIVALHFLERMGSGAGVSGIVVSAGLSVAEAVVVGLLVKPPRCFTSVFVNLGTQCYNVQ